MNRFAIRSINALLLGVSLLTLSCKKDVDVLTPTTGSTQNLAFVGPQWQMSAFLLDPSVDFDGDGKADSDILPFMPACDRDNAIIFNADGKISGLEGQLRCDNEPAKNQKPDTWRYNDATKTITITDGEDPTDVSTWEVVEVSSKKLTIKTTVVEDGVTFNASIHWKAL
ncbi:MAG: hypothetical protein JWP57_2634 [Spirosoma sp.]|nr:hypothetical protein [Spirosoma sp.]